MEDGLTSGWEDLYHLGAEVKRVNSVVRVGM